MIQPTKYYFVSSVLQRRKFENASKQVARMLLVRLEDVRHTVQNASKQVARMLSRLLEDVRHTVQNASKQVARKLLVRLEDAKRTVQNRGRKYGGGRMRHWQVQMSCILNFMSVDW